ncbi:MAG: hypothetical protein QOD06_2166 [Candidatus Binatota bacterium]|nr:hypothetical protein [Candidatus Binatota bacterium]
MKDSSLTAGVLAFTVCVLTVALVWALKIGGLTDRVIVLVFLLSLAVMSLHLFRDRRAMASRNAELALLAHVATRAADGVLITDRDGRTLWVNDAFTRSSGYSLEELVGRKPGSILQGPDTDPAVVERIREALRSRRSCHEEILNYDKSRKPYWISLSIGPDFDADGHLVRFIGIAADVTARKRDEERLVHEAGPLASCMRLAGLGVFRWVPGTDRFRGSAELDRLIGRSRREDEEPLSSFLASVHADDRGPLARALRDGAASGTPVAMDVRIAVRDGTFHVFELLAEERPDTASREIHGVLRDVSEARNTADELARDRDRAIEGSRLKTAFIAEMSHGVRTPLNVMLGYNRLLADHLADVGDHSQDPVLDGIEKGGKRLIESMDRILDLSRIESGSFEPSPQPMRLADAIDREVAALAADASDKGLSLTTDVEDRQATVVFDERCLRRGIANLIDNAIRFTDQGSVAVQLYRNHEGMLTLDFADTGVGIDESLLKKMLEPYGEEDDGSGRRFEGGGIGLALAKRYFELNGARLSISSRRGAGSTARVHFPEAIEVRIRDVTEQAAMKPASASAAAPGNGNARNAVLLVEDDVDTQIYMRAVLGKRYHVYVASSGEEMRAHLAEHLDEIRLVLMDLSLKGDQDGLMLMRLIRRTDAWKELPVISVTAHALPGDVKEALDAGANAFLAKPFEYEQLLSLMDLVAPAAA